MELKERLKNLTEQFNNILDQLANITHPDQAMVLISARERLYGAINILEVIIKDKKDATDKRNRTV